MPNHLDPVENREWSDALDSVLEFEGAERASFQGDELHAGAAQRDPGALLVAPGGGTCDCDPRTRADQTVLYQGADLPARDDLFEITT